MALLPPEDAKRTLDVVRAVLACPHPADECPPNRDPQCRHALAYFEQREAGFVATWRPLPAAPTPAPAPRPEPPPPVAPILSVPFGECMTHGPFRGAACPACKGGV